MCNEDDVNTIAEELMAYLQRRPMASDSLDGIIYWWLEQQSIFKNKSLVEKALKQLVKQGKISKAINSNRKAVYSLGTEFKLAKD